MKGLLLKDFYVAKKNLRTFLIMILAFSLGSLAAKDSGNFFLCYDLCHFFHMGAGQHNVYPERFFC